MEQQVSNGGLQYVPQIAMQYVYLDFDGELTSYNGEILNIDNVEVQNSRLTAERISSIVAELNTRYAAQNVIFVTSRPESIEYSTIYIGKTEAFSPYGSFAGLAETIDKNNQNLNYIMMVILLTRRWLCLLGMLENGNIKYNRINCTNYNTYNII